MGVDKIIEDFQGEREAGADPDIADDNKPAADDTIVDTPAEHEVHEESTCTCDTGQEDDDRGLPIDRGWAWVVLAGATFYLILFGSIRKNFGIIFVAFLSRFQSSASVTSLLTTTQAIVNSISSLVVMTIGMHYMSHRTSIMIGGCLLTLANIITAFASDIRVLILSFGLIEGIGTSMIHPPITAILAEYFSKKRGFANGFAFSGASLGGLVFAPIITLLFDNYGYTGTMLIVAGMMCNILVTGSLMRPIKSFERKPSRRESKSQEMELLNPEDELSALENEQKQSLVPFERGVSASFNYHGPRFANNNRYLDCPKNEKNTRSLLRSESYEPRMTSEHQLFMKKSTRRTRTVSERHERIRTFSAGPSNVHVRSLKDIVDSISMSSVALYASGEGFTASIVDIQEITGVEDENTESPNRLRSFCVSLRTSAVSKLKLMFDMTLLRNPVFIVFLLMATCFASTCSFLLACIAPLGKDIGVSSRDIGIVMSVVGGCGMGSRLLMAMIVDRKCVRLTTVLAGAAMLSGLVAHLVSFLDSFNSLLVLGVILGLTCDLYRAMYSLVLVEYLTLAKLKSTVGFAMLCHGLSTAATFPILGYLRDLTGSYSASYHLLGTMSMVGGVLALLIPVIHSRCQQTEDITEEVMEKV